jgi:hypothetical protein
MLGRTTESPNLSAYYTLSRNSSSALPAELLHAIFSYVLDLDDVACLALCSRQLWAVGEAYVRREATAWLGAWAGNQLICVGDLARSLPKRVEFPSADRTRLGRHGNDLCRVLGGYGDFELYKMRSPSAFLRRTLLQRGVSQGDWRCVDELVRGPPAERLVLRNLSTREYIRGEAVEAINGERRRTWAEHGQLPWCVLLQLADALVPLLFWLPPEHTGPWAGCRFDITHIDDVRGDPGDDGERAWRDFTLEGMRLFQSALDDSSKTRASDVDETVDGRTGAQDSS